MKIPKQWLMLIFLSLLPLVISHCRKEDDTAFTYFKDSLGCYPNLPSPDLIYTGEKEVRRGSDGNGYDCYKLSIENCTSFPFELFTVSPDLPPCGSNPNASRTWVNIYNSETDEHIYGYCGFTKPQDACELQLPVPWGDALPIGVYVKYIDRKCELEYVSNTIVIDQ
jgi:hypothetical protein